MYPSLIDRAWQRSPLIFVTMLFLAVSTSAAPNDQPAKPTQTYAFEFLTFKADSAGQTFLEVFCQIPTESFQFIKTKDGFKAGYEIAITLLDANYTEAASLEHADSVMVSSYNEIFLPREPHLVRFTFLLNPGGYLAKVKITDPETLAEIRFEKKIVMPDYFESGLKLSSLQLAASISQSARESALVKNNLKIIPNVPRIFGMDFNTLYVYSEIYNLSVSEGMVSSSFNATVAIFDHSGQVVKTVTHTYPKPATQCVLSFGLPIDYLAPGNYKLAITVEDLQNGQTAIESAHFAVVKPFVTQTDDEYHRTVRQLKYLASEAELAKLQKLSKSERENGFLGFLKQFDASPQTEQNEFMLEYYRRIFYASQNFYSASNEGWNTAQGEVYVKNGPPDAIERQFSDNKNYEVWQYYKLNRKFIFVDEWGLGQYQLLKTVEAAGKEYSLQ